MESRRKVSICSKRRKNGRRPGKLDWSDAPALAKFAPRPLQARVKITGQPGKRIEIQAGKQIQFQGRQFQAQLPAGLRQ
jgi:hypothetical protein